MMTRIDLNSDLGERDSPEGLAIDADMMPLITSVSIACGGHAGTPDLMRRTARLAAQFSVSIGAHPGLPDPQHFGRREQTLPAQTVTALVIEQIQTLADILSQEGLALTHVKPHGALYNMATKDPDVARAMVRAVQTVDCSLQLYALAGSVLAAAARAAGLSVIGEAFADRAYRADGSLVPRSEKAALLEHEEEVRLRVRHLITGSVCSIDGKTVPVLAESLCLHAETPQAVLLARIIRHELDVAGVRIMAARKNDA